MLLRALLIFCLTGCLCYVVWTWYEDYMLLRTVTNFRRGTRSERRLILYLLKCGASPDDLYHDLYVRKSNGQYSQIDALLVTRVGIVVFEVKDYSGWLFGNGAQSYWTQVLSYGKVKYRFYNPVMQNKVHIETLKQRIAMAGNIPVFSVVIFYGSCHLKNVSNIPEDTYIGYSADILPILKDIHAKNPDITYCNSECIVEVLKESVANGDDDEIVRQHVWNIRNNMYHLQRDNNGLMLKAGKIAGNIYSFLKRV